MRRESSGDWPIRPRCGARKAGLFRDPDLQIAALVGASRKHPTPSGPSNTAANSIPRSAFWNQPQRGRGRTSKPAKGRAAAGAGTGPAAGRGPAIATWSSSSGPPAAGDDGGLTVVALIAGVACIAAIVPRNQASKLAQIAGRKQQRPENAQRAEQSQQATGQALSQLSHPRKRRSRAACPRPRQAEQIGPGRRGSGPQAAVHDRYATRAVRLERRSHHGRTTPRAAGETHSR